MISSRDFVNSTWTETLCANENSIRKIIYPACPPNTDSFCLSCQLNLLIDLVQSQIQHVPSLGQSTVRIQKTFFFCSHSDVKSACDDSAPYHPPAWWKVPYAPVSSPHWMASQEPTNQILTSTHKKLHLFKHYCFFTFCIVFPNINITAKADSSVQNGVWEVFCDSEHKMHNIFSP